MRPGLRVVPIVTASILLARLVVAQEVPDPRRYRIECNGIDTQVSADFDDLRLFGGFRFSVPSLGLEIRGASGSILADREARTLLGERRESGLPRRGVEPPGPRRRLSASEVRQRIERTIGTFGEGRPDAEQVTADLLLDLVRFLYFEGGVLVVHDGVEVLRCERLWISPVEDRVVAEDVELRYVAAPAERGTTVVVRGPRLVKTGSRWTGRDLQITTCEAAEPHVAVAVGEAEIVERIGELEITTRGQRLQIGGVSVMPLPDAHFFTGSQSQFPIRQARLGYSQKEGAEAEVVLGLPWNTTGGALHEWLTGRPASEFRGNWELGVGYIEERGAPLRPAVDYRAPGLYEGRIEGFWLDDQGRNLREIQLHLDGAPIDNESRGMVRTENRLHLGERTHLDLQAYSSTDPAVLSEFHGSDYRGEELPETSGYLHHQTSNHLITFGARSNLDRFSYRDDRALAQRFIEELPVFTWNWLAEPVAETPWQTPVVLDLATELGQRRSDYDERAGVFLADRTFRADQLLELSAPFAVGPISVRPYFASRGTYYDNSVAGEDESRVALEGGVQIGTRLSRAFRWTADEEPSGVRHVLAPRVSFMNRFHVDDRPAELLQFDDNDALTEQQLVRVEVRNLLEHAALPEDPAAPRDFFMLDLAQDLWPDKSRDNAGETLGLFYYDLLMRPRGAWVPLPTFAFAFYGDHDWDLGMRTMSAEVQLGPIAGLTWTLEHRADRVFDGAYGIGASTTLFDRWSFNANGLYDVDTDEWLNFAIGLVRNDHDWSILVGAIYDPFVDETSFNLYFLPRLPGLARPRVERYQRSALYGQGFATQY